MFDHQRWGVVDYVDSPQVLDAGVTPIPGSDGAFLQIVANLAKAAYRIRIVDGIQERFFGLYVGSTGNERLMFIFGIDAAPVVDQYIPEGSRICIRAMDPGPVSAHSLCIQFLG